MNQSISQSDAVNPARDAAVLGLIRAMDQLTLRPVVLDLAGLDDRDARLAEVIYRTTIQRWITINFLIDRFLTRTQIEPALRAILASAGAQLIFIDRLPAHAVVDVAVEQARRQVREGASRLVNAVLRRIAQIVAERLPDQPWQPANNNIPGEQGTIRLSRQALLKPRRIERYLSIATSHAPALVSRWLERFGEAQATELLAHSLQHPPTFVHDGQSVRLWNDDHAALTAWLSGAADRWVQDPTAALAASATAKLSPKLIVDFCAGKGTKTRQLAMLHAEARIIAADSDEQRFEVLRRSFAGESRVKVMPPNLAMQFAGQVDLLVLDVPCSNSGVLARRPEAKYRFSPRTVSSVIDLQRQIMGQAGALLADGGWVLYSTCSLEPEENEEQVTWACEQLGLTLHESRLTLPGGEGESYHDGGYWALLQRG